MLVANFAALIPSRSNVTGISVRQGLTPKMTRKHCQHRALRRNAPFGKPVRSISSRGDCDSFEPSPEIIADFVAVAMECRPGALGVLDELLMKAQTAIVPE